MSRLTATRLAWSLWALCVALTIAAMVLFALSASVEIKGSSRPLDLLSGLAFLAFPTVGALVASRRPENLIGWIFCGVGVVIGVSNFASEYAIRALLARPGSLPGGKEAAWLGSWLFLPGVVLAGTFLLLLFPEGRLLSPRWRPAVWLAAAAIAALSIGLALAPGPLNDDFAFLRNPFGIEGAGRALGAVSNLGFGLFFASILAGATALILRFRRARGVERQQLKWITSAAALIVLSFLAGGIAIPLYEPATTATEYLLLLAVAALPVAAGIAILRHRLYDIDLIVRRTLVYGVLSALLAALYFGIVLALQQAFSPITQGSELAVAGSTLAVAALFRPARRRVQAVVDRRFYRRKVDAARTLEAFAALLRREIDLEALTAELRAVVQDTLQPVHVSLWLRAREAPP